MHTNAYVDDKLLATYEGTDTYFPLTDWLGTKRAVVSAGACASTYASYAFGDSLTSGGFSGITVCADATEHHFTGKERDSASGLDYFAARYFSSGMGRWMSPDWEGSPTDIPYADFTSPQSLNLYEYVGNNPLSKTDKDGHCCDSDDPGTGDSLAGSPLEGITKTQTFQNITRLAVGGGLVASTLVGDAPGGAVGGVIIANALLGGTSAAVSGASGLIGQATHTDVSEGQKALSATSNIPGLVATAATGNLNTGQTVATLGNAASLATKPREAFKNAATAADAAQTVKDTAGVVLGALSKVLNFLNPPPPPAPLPPPPPVNGSNPPAP